MVLVCLIHPYLVLIVIITSDSTNSTFSGEGIGQPSQVSAVGDGSVASTNNPGVHEVQIEKGKYTIVFLL